MQDDGRVRIKRHYSIVAHSADVVELRHGAWNAISYTVTDESESGKLLGIVTRLDGRLSIDGIANAESVPSSEVEALINELSELGLLEQQSAHALDYYRDYVVPNLVSYGSEEREPRMPAVLLGDEAANREIARILNSSAPDNEYVAVPTDDRRRRILARGATKWLSDGLAMEEDMAAFADWRGRLLIVASSTVNPLELRAVNRVSLQHGFPWIHAAVDGPFLLVGPTFLPRRSACYECLETRVLMNLRQAESYVEYKRVLAQGRATRLTEPLDAVMQSMLASLTAFEALNFVLTGAAFTVGKMLAVYLPTMEFTFNEVLRLPACPACSPSPEADDTELYFELRTLLDDGVRSVDAADA